MPKSTRSASATGSTGQASGARRPRGRPRSAGGMASRRRSAAAVGNAASSLPPVQGGPPSVPAQASAPAPPPPPAQGFGESAASQFPSNFSPTPPVMPIISIGCSTSPSSAVAAVPQSLPVVTSHASGSITASANENMLTSVCDDLGMGVPKAIQDKIWNGDFVEFGSLLRPNNNNHVSQNDCVFMVGTHESLAWQIRPHNTANNVRITSIEQWTSAFLVFSSIYLMQHADRARQLLKYADTIRSAAFRRVGFGWRDYDVQFRLSQARMPARSWASMAINCSGQT